MFRLSAIPIMLVGSIFLMLSACAPTGIYHTVKPGQTLYRIALTYGVDEDHLARVNNIKDPTQLRVNQRVYIPGVSQLRKVPSTAATNSRPAPAQTATSQTTTTKKTSVENRPSPKKTIPTTTSSPEAVKGLFTWPVQGNVITKFGSQGQNVHKGIEISVPTGTGVKAAASGKVIYSGNAIPGYGNLIILEHSDSFFSVYGFNQRNLVKMDDFVGQGEKVALSGSPPNGQSPRLHFEIRKGKSAVNPILYLP